MAAARTFVVPAWLIPVAVGVAVLATAVLIAFPGNVLVWQAATWTLVGALLAVALLVLVSAWSLASNRAAKTWPRIASLLLGLACLVVLAVGYYF